METTSTQTIDHAISKLRSGTEIQVDSADGSAQLDTKLWILPFAGQVYLLYAAIFRQKDWSFSGSALENFIRQTLPADQIDQHTHQHVIRAVQHIFAQHRTYRPPTLSSLNQTCTSLIHANWATARRRHDHFISVLLKGTTDYLTLYTDSKAFAHYKCETPGRLRPASTMEKVQDVLGPLERILANVSYAVAYYKNDVLNFVSDDILYIKDTQSLRSDLNVPRDVIRIIQERNRLQPLLPHYRSCDAELVEVLRAHCNTTTRA